MVLFVAHFCGRGHRPRWLAVACFTVGIAVLIFATPELFAPKWDADGSAVVSLFGNSSKQPTFNKELCLTAESAKEIADQCKLEAPLEQNKNLWTFLLLGLAQIILGIGTTGPIGQYGPCHLLIITSESKLLQFIFVGISVLAMPFIDDNVKTKNTPIYFCWYSLYVQ